MLRRSLTVTLVLALGMSASCSATGSSKLSCATSEVAPNSQPGASSPGKALEWFLEHGSSGLPKTGYRLNSRTKTRSVYTDGTNQISVGALPAEKGTSPLWVVMLTFTCE